jgi:hypothetical protein
MKRNLSVLCTALAFGLFVFGGCVQDEPVTPTQMGTQTSLQISAKVSSNQIQITSEMLDAINLMLQADGKPFRLGYAEYITNGMNNQVGLTVYSHWTGNKQLGADFVPFDPRRAEWSGPVDGVMDDITYAIDEHDGAPPHGGLTSAQTTAAIVAAMQTWAQVSCSSVPLTRISAGKKDLGYTAYENRTGGSRTILADITHAGFNDMDYEGGVLGITFTAVFVDEAGLPTDVDNNGKLDVAYREIYYDPSWDWCIWPNMTGNPSIDVQSIAVHEAGHGLSQQHFGMIFQTEANGQLHFSPEAVMNALYATVRQELTGTDIAGHCSIWATWPNH